MMACKRKADVSEVKESKNAVVHGVITELSPVKKSRKNESVKYFSGQLCDGKDSVRVIYFEPCLREKMSDCFEKKEPVCLSNCQIRSGARGGSEVLLNKLTQVAVSPKKFDTNAAVLFRKESASVGMNSLVMDADVNVTVKVKSVDPVKEVKNRDGKVLKKQDCVVGDVDGCGRLVLWESDVGKVTEGGSYKLVRVTVKSFRDVNYLSVGQYCEILSSGRYWRDGGS
jgi:hypothetical protein